MKTTMKKSVKTISKTLAIFMLTSFMVFTSCSSNDESEIDSEDLSQVVMQDFKKDMENLKVPAGLANSSNEYAQQANYQFQSLKTLSTSFTTLFTIPPGATVTSSKSAIKTAAKTAALSTKTYTWSANGTTVKYTISEESDRYNFTYSIESAAITGKLMDGYQLKDRSYAEVKLYYDGITTSTIKWWVNTTSIKIELISDVINYILESNTTDNSGSLKLYDDNNLTETYIWNGLGSGSFTDHLTEQTYTW